MKKYLKIVSIIILSLFLSCNDDEGDDESTNGYDSSISLQENLDNGVPILDILEIIPVSDLYGLTYQGGLIYYINEADGSGLVVTPNDISSNAYFGCEGTEINGADGVDIGTGAQNTLDILQDCNDPSSAAKICANLDLNGYQDWFQPSINEYGAMRTNLYESGFGNFDNFYVSSSEYHAIDMYYISMIGGNQGSNHKDLNVYYLRASRAF